MKDQFLGTNIKKQVNIKIEQMNIDTFWNQFFFGVNRLFVLVYTNQDNASKRFKTGRYYLPKGIIKNYVIINGKKNLWSINWFRYSSWFK